MKLTTKTIAALTLPADKHDVIHFDSEVRGLGFRLRRAADGSTLKTWVYQYRHLGRSRRLLLGPEAIGAEKARALAKENLAKVWQGHDPSAEKAGRRNADKFTLRKAIDEFLAAKQRQLRPRTFVEMKRYLTTGYFKPLHNVPIDTITRQDVALRIRTIANESGNPTAAQARAKLSALYTWCMQEGLVNTNPIIGTRKPPENKSRDRVLDDSELAAVWKACGDDDFGRIIRLMILTACRREEIGGMAWSEFAPNASSWTLPAERSKNGRPLTLPMMPMMRTIVESVPKLATRDQLFGEDSLKGFTSWAFHKRTIDRHLAGQGRPWKLHDLRRSVATKMADIGIAPHVIEAVLNHHGGHRAGVAGVYNRSPYEREVRNALGLWEDHIRALVAGGERKVLAYPAGTAISGPDSAA
jgi:integrase